MLVGFFTWVTVIMGTVLALFFVALPGAGKLISGHPFKPNMVFGFDKVFGPFLGCPGIFLRIFIGVGELAAGLGLLIGLWGDALGLYDKDLSALAKSLIIVAGVALMTLCVTASSMHYYLDGHPHMFLAMLSVLCLIFVFLRTFLIEPTTWATQMLCVGFCGALVLLAFVTIIFNKLFGKHQNEVREENLEFQKLTGAA
mmetsp:Transcript_81440/g.263791  ORF Transcript_81440/g.263791 Transcript_81440/m.263791 type:complete len:199 (-) Transcript_81440:98-694(-)